MERYTTMKYQLEYFYLIHTGNIVNKVKQDIYGNSAESTSILETIFKYVFDGISLYGGFIKLDSYSPFFHERPYDAQIRGICQLLYVALQNNCILNAFFHELSSVEEPDIKITGKSEKLIKNSVLNTILPTSNKPDKTKPEEIARSQFFQNRKKIFENPQDVGTYVNQTLKAMDTSGRKGEVLPLTVMKYIAPTANFLFTEDSCTKFGRVLRDKKDVADKYNILWNKYNEIKDAYESVIDKLIFETGMNAVFGFTFFESICKFIDIVHNKPVSEKKTLRDLEGQPFVDIIFQAANLPMFFNKELFVKFACYAFVSSQNTDYSYFEDSPKAAVTAVSPPRSNQQQAIYGLDLMRKFFRILSSVTLPVLYSLWETVVYEIRREKPELFTIDSYKNYLSDNYNSIVYDYVPIPDETISKWGASAFTAKKHINNNALLKYIKENPVCYQETTSKGKTIKHIFPLTSSEYSMEYIQQLIQTYCNIQMLKESRAPFFFLTKSELPEYSPLTPLIKSLSADEDFMLKGKSTTEENSFLIRHRNDLFYYLFSRK